MEAAINYLIPVLIKEEAIINFSISPNPVQDFLLIDLSELQGNSFTLEVIDISGRLMIQTTEKNINTILPVSQLKEGIYILQIKSGKQTKNCKFVIKRHH